MTKYSGPLPAIDFFSNEKMSEELAIQQAIQTYLNTSNRPYNANNLIDEFATKFKKAKVIKALQVLVSFNREIQTFKLSKLDDLID